MTPSAPTYIAPLFALAGVIIGVVATALLSGFMYRWQRSDQERAGRQDVYRRAVAYARLAATERQLTADIIRARDEEHADIVALLALLAPQPVEVAALHLLAASRRVNSPDRQMTVAYEDALGVFTELARADLKSSPERIPRSTRRALRNG